MAALSGAVGWFVWQQLAGSWDALQSYNWQINWWLLITASAVQLVALTLFSAIWCYLMRGFGYVVPLRAGFRIAYLSHLGRYVPGRIWQVFSMIELAAGLGIARSDVIASWAISTLFGIPPALLAGLGAMLLFPEIMSANQQAIYIPLLAVATTLTMAGSVVCVVWPSVALGVYNWLLRLLKRPPVSFSFRPRVALMVYLGYLIGWLITGGSFWLFVQSITAINVPLLPMVGGFILAYQVGYFTIFTPGGLGSRELVLIAMLSPFVGPIAAGVALAGRVWNLLVEVLATLIAFMIPASGANPTGKLPVGRSGTR